MKKIDLEKIVEKLDDYFAGKSKILFFLVAFVVVLYFCSAVIAPLCTGLNEYSQDLSNRLEKEYNTLANPADVSASIEREKIALKSNESQKKELEEEKKIYTAKVGSFANKFFSSQDVNKHINEVAEQSVVFGYGALRKSARELEIEMQIIQSKISSKVKETKEEKPASPLWLPTTPSLSILKQ